MAIELIDQLVYDSSLVKRDLWAEIFDRKDVEVSVPI